MTLPEFDTTPFERIHGRKPRGRRRYWFSPQENPVIPEGTAWCSPRLTYSKAKRMAAAVFIESPRLFVQP